MHERLIAQMIAYDAGDPKRIQHFMKVYAFAQAIGTLEALSDEDQFVLNAAAIVHDIGIKISEEKYGSAAAKYQELEGPAVALPMLRTLGYAEADCKKICWLIAHHHTYQEFESIVHQILIEADFLVNLFEDEASPEAIQSAYKKIFRTGTGKCFCKQMFSCFE